MPCMWKCVCVNKFTIVHVNHWAKVSEEVSTEDWLLDIGNVEYPG